MRSGVLQPLLSCFVAYLWFWEANLILPSLWLLSPVFVRKGHLGFIEAQASVPTAFHLIIVSNSEMVSVHGSEPWDWFFRDIPVHRSIMLCVSCFRFSPVCGSALLNGSSTGGAMEKPELRKEDSAGCRPFCRGHSGLHLVPSYSEQQWWEIFTCCDDFSDY